MELLVLLIIIFIFLPLAGLSLAILIPIALLLFLLYVFFGNKPTRPQTNNDPSQSDPNYPEVIDVEYTEHPSDEGDAS